MIRELIQSNPAATDAQILAMPVTLRPIPLAELAAYLRTFGLRAKLAAIVADANTPDLLRIGLTDFLDHLGDPRQVNLNTTTPAIAIKVAQILGALLSPAVPEQARMTLAEREAIYAMGGGLLHADATEQTITDERAAMLRDVAIESLWALAVDEHNSASALHQTRNGKIANLRNDPLLPVPATLAELDGESA